MSSKKKKDVTTKTPQQSPSKVNTKPKNPQQSPTKTRNPPQQSPTKTKTTKSTVFKIFSLFDDVMDNSIWFPGFLAEIFMAFLYWHVTTQFPASIWFINVNDMRVSDTGEEFLYLIGFLSPLLLIFPPFMRLVWRFYGLFLGALLLVFPSFYLTGEKLSHRCILHSVALGLGQLGLFANFWREYDIRKRTTMTTLIGLFISTCSRFYYKSFTPLFITPMLSWYLCGVGILCVLILSFDYRPLNMKLILKTKPSLLNDIRFGIGFGSILFLIIWFASEHGVIARWIGLDPAIHGLGVIMSLFMGILISSFQSITRSILWKLLGIASGPAFVYLPNHQGMYAAFFFILFIVSIWVPTVVDMGTKTHAGITLFISMLLYIVGILCCVWTVAFPFVPFGGELMREQITTVFFVMLVLTILCHFSTIVIFNKSAANSLPSKYTLWVLLIAIIIILVPSILIRSHDYRNYDGKGIQKENINAMIWAIRFGYDNKGWINAERVAEKIRKVGANVIGLVETDTMRPMNGNWDIMEYLSEELHMYYDYGPSTLNETWGCGLLSVYPIISSSRVSLPSPDGEIACLIDATLDVNGNHVDVIVTHFGNKEHVEDRRLQTLDTATRGKAKRSANKKAIWLGYLTDSPRSDNYNKVVDSGWKDVSPNENRWCLYIFQMGLEVLNFKRIDTGVVSDTEIQIATFKSYRPSSNTNN